jgi:hypothetical protein
MKKDILNKILDFIFSKNNTKYLILLLIIGITLRIILASIIGGSPDEMVYGVHSIGIINSGLLQEMTESPVWMYLTDLGYKIFGITLLSSRLLSIIFGSLTIIALYFLTKEMFNKKIALISSFLLTFSAYHILTTLTEMDIAMTFFIILSSYFLIKYLKEKKINYLIVSIIVLGIGILMKSIGILFIPAYLCALILYPKIKNKQKILSRKTIKTILIFAAIIFIMVLPILTFNYILYKEKGLTDLQFSRFLSGENKGIYQSLSHTIQPFSVETLLVDYGGGHSGIMEGLRYYWSFSIFLFIASILGIIIGLKGNKNWTIYLLILFTIPFVFLSGTSLLPKHFVFAIPIFCIFSSLTLDKISGISKKNSKHIILALLLLFLIISAIKLIPQISEKNSIQKTIEYKNNNIEKESFVIIDSRIYNGRTAFMFSDRYYLETNYLPTFLEQINQYQTDKKIKTYVIECVADDCGWGTMNEQQEFNKTTENIISNLKGISVLKKTIYAGKEQYLNIWETKFPFVPGMLESTQETHNFLFYPVNYQPKEKIILKYEANNPFHKFLDRLSHIILYIQLLIALLTIPLIVFLLTKNYEDEAINNNANI